MMMMKPSFVFLLLLLISLHSFSVDASPFAGSSKDPNSVAVPRPQAMKMKIGRKLIGVNGLLLDYEPPGANPAHDPSAPGRKGGRGGNP